MIILSYKNHVFMFTFISKTKKENEKPINSDWLV